MLIISLYLYNLIVLYRICFPTKTSSVSPVVLVGAIQRLEKVELFYDGMKSDRMTAEQITAVLAMLKENQQGRLKELEIYSYGKAVSRTLLQQARLNNAVKINVTI